MSFNNSALTPSPDSSQITGQSSYWESLRLSRLLRNDRISFLLQNQQKYGDLALLKMGPYRIFQINDPELIQEVLIKYSRHFYKTDRTRQVFGRWNGNALFLSEGRTWTTHRKIIGQTLSPKMIRHYTPMAKKHSQQFVEELHKNPHQELKKSLGNYSLSVLLEALFGQNLTHEHYQEFHDSVEVIQQSAIKDMVTPFLLPLWFPMPRLRKLKKSISYLNLLVKNLLQKMKEKSQEEQGDSPFLQILHSYPNEQLSDEELCEEMINLILAGHDTTSAGIIWTLFFLAHNPSVQQRVYEELTIKQEKPTDQKTNSSPMSYLKATYYESLRLYPPAYMLGRQLVKKELTLGKNIHLKKGDIVFIPTYLIQRKSSFFSNPEDYLPERFLEQPESHWEKVPYFLPFGLGPRNCVGKDLAVMESLSLLSEIIKNFHIIPMNPQDQFPAYSSEVSLHPKNDCYLSFKPRTCD